VSEPLTDWVAWHQPYADPSSPLSRRRRTVQRHVADWLDALPASGLPARIVSACAGDGGDVLEVLAARPAVAAEVDVLLVELDHRIATDATTYATDHGLSRVTVRVEDAGRSDAFADAVPAGLVLFCGVFGNIADDDVRGTIAALPSLCAPGATVLWTRGLRAGRTDAADDVTTEVRGWFADAGFAEVAFDAPDSATWSVGAHRLAVEPSAFTPGRRLFTFVR
jgi:hypothetical protein